MTTSETIAVTGVTGQLGRLVIAELKAIAPGARIVGVARNPAAAKGLGIEVRAGDYANPASLGTALANVDKVLLISSSEIGQRVPQHRAVIEAAKAAGVKLLAYTSILRADTSPMGLATEHRETEALIRQSGLPFVFLRNGWYQENYTGNIGAALEHSAVLGAAQDGKISAASRADYAAAAATALVNGESSKIYELAGDTAFTMPEYAAEVAQQSGKPVVYKDLPEADYKAALQSVGLPAAFAAILAESDAKAARGSLFDDSRTLSRLIGRPTTTIAQAVATALAKSA